MFENIKRLGSRCDLVLGSRSPRRVELLRELDLQFEQIVTKVEERRRPAESPFEFALRLAREKAIAVCQKSGRGSIVIGCDTIVVLDDEVLQKPGSREQAARILSRLSGQRHVVCTALALARHEAVLAAGFESTGVYFNGVSKEQIYEYIDTGEPMDKAGAYGIQGMGAFLVDRIDGNLDNVIGLPRSLLDRLAAQVIADRKNQESEAP